MRNYNNTIDLFNQSLTPAPTPAPAPPVKPPQPFPEKPIGLPVIINEPIDNTRKNEPLFDLTLGQPSNSQDEQPHHLSPGYVDFDNPAPEVKPEAHKPALWDIPHFDGLKIPQMQRLDGGSTISDVQLCIDSHLLMVRANNGKKAYLPYLQRLNKIHSLIKQD